MAGDWVIEQIFPMQFLGKFQDGVISFLVSAVVIFTTTLAIEYGNVPLGGSLLAALIIGTLMSLIPANRHEVREKREV